MVAKAAAYLSRYLGSTVYLEKKKIYSENKTKNELNAFATMIEAYETIWSGFNLCTSIIEIMIQNNQVISILATDKKFMSGIHSVKEQCIALTQKEANFCVYLPIEFNDNIKNTLAKILEWSTFVERSVEKYDIDENSRIQLLHLNSDVRTRILQNLTAARNEINSRAI